MRHRVNKSRLSLSQSKRKALLTSLSKSIIIHARIITTKERAKNVRGFVEHLISLGKQNSLSAKRQVYKVLGDHVLVSKLFNEIAPKFKSRTGGYTRIMLLRRRRGDNAQMCLLELTEKIKEIETTITKKEKAKAKSMEDKHKAEKKITKEQGLKEKEVKSPEQEKPRPIPEEARKEKRIETIEKKKPPKKILGGLRRFFKKERDAL